MNNDYAIANASFNLHPTQFIRAERHHNKKEIKIVYVFSLDTLWFPWELRKETFNAAVPVSHLHHLHPGSPSHALTHTVVSIPPAASIPNH